MKESNKELIKTALTLIDIVMRDENVEINVMTYPSSIQAYDAETKCDIERVERKFTDD